MQLQSIDRTPTDGEGKPTENAVKAWYRLVRAQQAVLTRVEEDLKRAGYPSLEWYDVLLELDHAETGTLAQAEVQNRILLAQYNLCRLVDRMERDGMVRRRPSPDDGRSNLLVITEAGRAMRRAMWPVYAAAIQAHFGSHLTCPEAISLDSLLGKLLQD
jgi:DNA-binding MarR family transcriptional regulator